LAALCNYEAGSQKRGAVIGLDPDTNLVDGGTEGLSNTPEFKKVLPLLDHLSTNPKLGRVAVTKAFLGDSSVAVAPKEDTINVFLGDLHAPIMVDKDQTYGGVKAKPATGIVTTGSAPGDARSEAEMAASASRHPMKGRYAPAAFNQRAIPKVAGTLGTATYLLAKRYQEALSSAKEAMGVLPGDVGAVIALWSETGLGTWEDPEGANTAVVEDWLERYHGHKGKKGADIFEDAGADLKIWLDLLISYQVMDRGELPGIRLAQLGDLFDFWIGLKWAFDKADPRAPLELGTGKPTAAAIPFAEYWRRQTLNFADPSGGLNLLVRFLDEGLPPGKKMNPIFLYGNHDNYLGLLEVEGKLPAQFKEDPGLVAQHGHQADEFNADDKARMGHLLTQAAFVSSQAREIEYPFSALLAQGRRKLGARLTYTEMALEESVFRPLLAGERPAMTFVMGHTHEPVLQEIVVLESPGANLPTSQESEYSYTPPEVLIKKVQVAVRFMQVDLLDDGYAAIPAFFMEASIREARKIQPATPLAPRIGGILIKDTPARAGRSIPAESSANWTLVMDVCEELEIRVGTCNGHTLSQKVPALCWGGTRTLEYHQPSQKGRYKVTFELVWGDLVG
jgi:predicted phosphodiesterase